MNMIKERNKLYFLLIIGIVLISLIIFLENRLPAEVNTNSNTVDWKIYENQQMLFSVQYLPD